MDRDDTQIRFEVALENLKDVVRDILDSNGITDLMEFFRRAYARKFSPEELNRFSRALFEVKKPFWKARSGAVDLEHVDELLIKLFTIMPVMWIGKDSLYDEILKDEDIFDPHAFQFDYLSKLDELSVLILKNRPSPRVQQALSEARESYLCGLNAACVVFCRAVMEQRLKEQLKGKPYVKEEQQLINDNFKRPPEQRRGELELLIDRAEARGMLSAKSAEKAHEIRLRGNDAVHRAQVFTTKVAKEILESTQEILGAIEKSSS